MDFSNRIKKEMSEGVIRAILVDAGYRVIGLGIENVIREAECLTALEYAGLDFPRAMKSLPDLLVMNKEQTEKHLVEIKYRSNWNASIFDEIEDQVHLFKQIVLVYLNSKPPLGEGTTPSPSSYLRCCLVRSNNNVIEVQLHSHDTVRWIPREKLGEHAGQWWGLQRIQDILPRVGDSKEEKTLMKAVEALQGILNS